MPPPKKSRSLRVVFFLFFHPPQNKVLDIKFIELLNPTILNHNYLVMNGSTRHTQSFSLEQAFHSKFESSLRFSENSLNFSQYITIKIFQWCYIIFCGFSPNLREDSNLECWLSGRAIHKLTQTSVTHAQLVQTRYPHVSILYGHVCHSQRCLGNLTLFLSKTLSNITFTRNLNQWKFLRFREFSLNLRLFLIQIQRVLGWKKAALTYCLGWDRVEKRKILHFVPWTRKW